MEEFMSVYDTTIDLYKEYCRDHGGKLSQEDLHKITNDIISSSKIGALTSGEVAAYLTMVDMTYISNNRGSTNALTESQRTLHQAHALEGDDVGSLFMKTDVSWQNTASADPISFLSKFLEGEMKTEESSIHLPILTDFEKNSTLGAMLCYIMGLFLSLKQRILDERMLKETETDGTSSEKSPNSSLNAANADNMLRQQSNDVVTAWKQHKRNKITSTNSCAFKQHKSFHPATGKTHGDGGAAMARPGQQVLVEDKPEVVYQDLKSSSYPSRIPSNQQTRPYFYPTNQHGLQTSNWTPTDSFHGFNMYRDATYFYGINNHTRDEQDQKLHQWQVQQQQHQQQQHLHCGIKRGDQYYSMPLPNELTPKTSSSARRDPIFRQSREGHVGDMTSTVVQSHLSFDHQLLTLERYTLQENQPSHEYATDDLEPYQIPPRNRALSLSLHSLDFDVKDSDESSTDSSTGENRLESHRIVENKRKSSDYPDTARSSSKCLKPDKVKKEDKIANKMGKSYHS